MFNNDCVHMLNACSVIVLPEDTRSVCVCCVGVDVVGPPHAPVFKACVTLHGWDYTGKGTSKKSAKVDAANNALMYLDGVGQGNGSRDNSVPTQAGQDPGKCCEYSV